MKYAILLLFLLVSTSIGAGNYKVELVKQVKKDEKVVLTANITEGDFRKQSTKTGCYRACRNILNKIGLEVKKDRQLLIEEGNELKVMSKDYSSIDSQLVLCNPVVVGVHHTFRYGFNEGTTDHFLLIVEKNYDSLGLYYRFYDVGTRFGTNKDLKLRQVGDKLVYSGRKTYFVSQIRRTYGRTIKTNGANAKDS